MGCGQSKIGNFYSKNKKNKNGSKRNGFSTRSASIEQKNGNATSKANKTNNNGAEVNRNEELNGSLADKSLASAAAAKKKPIVPGGGPLLQQTEISTSQLDFFKMLDEKIESGPDYDESSDSKHRREHMATMLRRWELASTSWSSVAELNRSNSFASPGAERYAPASLRQLHHQHQPAHQMPSRGHVNYKSLPTQIVSGGGGGGSKDRERRFDGLQDLAGYHCPSPTSMPRHVLEPISQSPTQSLRPPPSSTAQVSSPTQLGRYGNGGAYSPYGRHEPPSPGALIRNSPGNPYVHQFQIQGRNRVT